MHGVNIDDFIEQSLQFKISEAYDIRLQRYNDEKRPILEILEKRVLDVVKPCKRKC